ncbi:Pentatricopeptide repeat-containing protein At5g08510 [Dionaea muscipula]
MIHARFIMSGCEADLYALTPLVDMYAKLGLVESTRKQFDQIQSKDVPTWNSTVAWYARCGDMNAAAGLFWLMPSRNVISWTAMVSEYSQNGHHVDALRMFLLMEKETDLVPNEVTIASVLPACANLGALEIG